MSKHPLVQRVPVEELVDQYGATFFLPALARFVTCMINPDLTAMQLECASAQIILLVHSVSVYHKIQYNPVDTTQQNANITVDSIHVQPKCKDSHGREVPAHFDTGLVYTHNEAGRKIDHMLFQIISHYHD